MGRCSVARRPLDKLGTSLYRRAGGIGQKYPIKKGQQPETYDQHADDDGCAGDATLLITAPFLFQPPTSNFHIYSISNVNCSAVAMFW